MDAFCVAALITRAPGNDEFLLVKQEFPPKVEDDEYDSYVDSELYDLPSSRFCPVEREDGLRVFVDGAEAFFPSVPDLGKLSLEASILELLGKLGLRASDVGDWAFKKYAKEAEFGPGSHQDILFVTGNFLREDIPINQESCKWFSYQNLADSFFNSVPESTRVGPLAATGIVNESSRIGNLTIPPPLFFQEFPPGVLLVPMRSRTGKPFHTTTLVLISPNRSSPSQSNVSCGDALLVDPGCSSQYHDQLREIVKSLPKKLIVFVTHHHADHVDDYWSLKTESVCGGERICISGEMLTVIPALGHTDGHMALLHDRTRTLIVGDHCVGQGSAVLDASSGGNMEEYYKTTYRFMDLSPRFIIPMHGRVNLWPNHMLCTYLKNRRRREELVREAMVNGAKTVGEVVSCVYKDVTDAGLLSLASSNVRLHIEHLALHHRL